MNHEEYFYSLIPGHVKGSAAPDWKQVLEALHASGVPKNPPPGYAGTPPQPYNGLTIMIDGGGNARGRIWYYSPHPNGQWFTSEFQVIEGPEGAIRWAWFQTSGGVPYPISSPAPEPPVDPELEQRIARLEKTVLVQATRMSELEDQLDLKVGPGDRIALRVDSGKIICVSNGGPQTDNRPINLESRSGVGPWETLILERGQG